MARERRKAGAGPEAGRAPGRRALGGALLFAALCLACFVALEGLASVLLFARSVQKRADRPVIAERLHTVYDPELGWVNRPGARIPDLYGPGKDMAINARGFRADRDLAPAPAPGVHRVICSGDSFTLGYGVAGDETWCHGLEARRAGVETVNMGQGGYGLDQAWLWYLRDGLPLVHHAHLLAFVFDDFERTGRPHFLGYGKPFLVLEDGKLRNANAPAPRRGFLRRWLLANGHVLRELRVVALGDRLRARLAGGRPDAEAERERTWEVVEAVFEDLRARHREAGRRFALVFLPTPWDRDTELSTGWRERVAGYGRRRGVAVLDLVAELRRMDGGRAAALFIPEGEPGHPHLSVAGNAWVADRVAATLLAPGEFGSGSAANARRSGGG